MDDKDEEWKDDFIEVAARTDVGMRRSMNQDSFRLCPATAPLVRKNRGSLFVVADGMGAHVAGEVASRLATDVASQSYLKRVDENVEDSLRNAITDAHNAIRSKGLVDVALRGMGTTCDALALTTNGAFVGHVGDSRAYRLRDGVLEQITFDHSLFWEIKYIPNSHAQYRQKSAVVPKNIITRSLGPMERVEVDVEGPFPIRPNDVFLLCSDGLSGRLDDAEIGQILRLLQPKEATDALVNLANLRGGSDNITAVVVRAKAEQARLDAEERADVSENNDDDSGSTKRGLKRVLSGACGALLTPFAKNKNKAIVSETRDERELEREKIPDGRRRAPYATTDATPSRAFAVDIEDVCAQLCEAIRQQPAFVPDWTGVSNARDEARIKFERGDYAGALRANLSVVNYVMRELRKFAQNRQERDATTASAPC